MSDLDIGFVVALMGSAVQAVGMLIMWMSRT